MKRYWTRLAGRIDAMNQRERVLVFAMLAAVTIALLNALLIDPLWARHDAYARQIKQDQDGISAIQAQLQSLLQASGKDLDAGSRARLQKLKQDIAQTDETMRAMQKGLVQPDRMPALLEEILRHEERLQLVSMKTLPAAGILDSEEGKEKPPAAARPDAKKADAAAVAAEGPLVYKHGVELVVQGSYADLLHYLARLEGSPWQMFWGKAVFRVEEYPKATLTLTLYTLSLDKTWLTI